MAQFGVIVNSDQDIHRIHEITQRADNAKLDFLWLHDTKTVGSYDVWSLLGNLVSITNHIHIGPGVYNLFALHPALATRAIITLDHISNGRALLGIGVGAGSNLKFLGNAFAEFITQREHRPLTAIKESVSIFKGLMSGKEFTFDGQVFSVGKDKVSPPVKPIPIYLGVQNLKSAEIAGQIAEGILTPAPLCFIEQMRKRILKGLDSRNQKAEHFRIANEKVLVVSNNPDQAYKQAQRIVAFELLWAPKAVHKALNIPSESIQKLRSDALRDAERALSYVTREIIDEYAIVGTPKECLDSIEDLHSHGINEITFKLPLDSDLKTTFSFIADHLILSDSKGASE